MSGSAALASSPAVLPPVGLSSGTAFPARSSGAALGAERGASPGAPPGGPPEAPQGAPPGAFQSALATHWARTATAEGHQNNSSQAGRGARAHANALVVASLAGGFASATVAGAATSLQGQSEAGIQPRGSLTGAQGAASGAESPQGDSPNGPPNAALLVSDALDHVGLPVPPSGSVSSAPDSPLAPASVPTTAPGSTTAPVPTTAPGSTTAPVPTTAPGSTTAPVPTTAPAPTTTAVSSMTPVPASASVPITVPGSAKALASTAVSAPASAPTSPSASVSVPAPSSGSAPVIPSAPATAPVSTGATAAVDGPLLASAPASAATADATSRRVEQQGTIVASTRNGLPTPNLSGQAHDTEGQDGTDASIVPPAQSAPPAQNATAGVPALGSTAAPAIENGVDARTGDERPGRFLADIELGRAAGSQGVGGPSAKPSATNPTQAQPTDFRAVSNASPPANASDAQPMGASNAQTITVVSGSTPETSAQSVAGIGAAPMQAPSFSTATNAASVIVSGVPMQDVIDSIHATVAMAARQGIVQARIELQPQELGQISIRLSQTSAGLSARVSADTAAGTQALAQGGSELRQSLSSLGVSLLRLDIGSSGQSHAREQGERSSGRPGRSGAAIPTTTPEDGDVLTEIEGESSPPGAARGEIVDVLA
jgi:flagellar hook-length control protein FliK